ncbi:MAG: DUF5050 domain-containing protein [Clostridiales bacterium]|nr:DUF5050 domain-containing protein [Clostridiales bacterium]
MKKKILALLSIIAIAFATTSAIACSSSSSQNDNPPAEDQPITGATLSDNTVTYDGNKHSLTVVGAPSGATIVYTYNGIECDGVVNAGTYAVVATISADGYVSKTLTATLVIEEPPVQEPEEMTGVSMSSNTVTYDGNKHSLTVVGAPSGATIVYTYNGIECDGVVNAGTYAVIATISADGYVSKTLTATLVIEEPPVQEPELKNFDEATLSNSTVDYNGKTHSIKVSGAPLGTNIVYTYNNEKCDGVSDAGTYTVVATLTKDGYNTKTLTATLVINKLNFENVTLTGYEVEYDGNKHSVLVNGKLPDNANVKYTYNGEELDSVTEAGSYTVTAVITAPNYNSKTLTATLKISVVAEDKEITGVTLKKVTVIEYDAKPHSVNVEGNLPVGAIVVYTYNGIEATSVTDKGNYKIIAKITAPGYKNLTLEATLSIIAPESQLYSINHNGTIYFQNNLDGNRLYTYNNGTLTRVNKDVAQYMISNGTNMYYYSNSLFSKVIKSVSTTGVSSLASVKGEWLTTDGTYIYYAVNNLLVGTDENGIYKLKIAPENDSEKIPVKLTTDKATYLTYHNDYIYYSNTSNKKYLTRISTKSSQANVGECLMEEAVSYIINDGTNLYFDASNGLASAIYKYNISNNESTKLTTDSGKYLTKVDNYIYYVNNDLLTSNLFGDGIYKVSINGNTLGAPGTKVLEAEDGNGYSSLTSDGTNLYYYKLNDKHFYRNTTSGTSEKDLMEGFVLNEKVTLAGYSKLAEYKGEIYYTDPTDDSALYKYNPTTKTNVKVLSDCVSNVYFHNGHMYYSTFILTNYALMRMNLTTNEIQKVTSERCDNLIFDGDTIYYVQISGGLFTNKIKSISVDGINETVILDGKNQWVYGFEKVDNVYYYVINPSFGYKYIYSYDADTKKESSLGIKAENFVIANDKIYYYSHTDNNLSSCNLDGTNETVIKKDLTIETMYLDGNNLYFSSTHKNNTGIYKCDISQSSPSATRVSSKKANGIVAYNGNVYFLNSSVSYVKDYPVQATDCDGKLYCSNNTNTPLN